jgi:Ca2+-binding RTX toxin-like protein
MAPTTTCCPARNIWGAADCNSRNCSIRPSGPPKISRPDLDLPVRLPTNYNPSNNPGSMVFDSSLRTISNLIVDQTLGNPAAIIKGLQVGGIVAADLANVALVQAIYAAFKPASDAEYQARVVMDNARIAANGLSDVDGNPNTPKPRNKMPRTKRRSIRWPRRPPHTMSPLPIWKPRATSAMWPSSRSASRWTATTSDPNVATDVGLSAPFNSWFTLFGQFFDHGLDLVNKGGSGTVFIPLQPDDPLVCGGKPHQFHGADTCYGHPGADGVMGTADDIRPVNTTTPFVDQNQTYTSHPSHQVFLRQYVLDANGVPHATGKLIEGHGGPGGGRRWHGHLGRGQGTGQDAWHSLTDQDVGAVPLLRTDAYGNFIPNAAGFAQIITGVGADGIPNTADDIVISGTSSAPIGLAGAARINAAFLADIAHDAVPNGIADGDIEIGLANPGNNPLVYDNELLDAHFIAGDGRANENIGLTAVHHIFHSEHNRLVEHTKEIVLASKDMAFINEWLDVDLTAAQVAAIPTDPIALATYANTLIWDGERLFQAAKFGTEMQYQHTVFEDFARKIQPNIDFFVVPDGYHADINPSIVAEFAHVVYRFGHSMLTEQIDRLDDTFTNDQISLIQGFLNPFEFDQGHTVADNIAAGDIIRGMTRQVGNEIDEFVTSALRNNLLGLPLDLATINLARGRDTGVPSLNAARRDFFEASSHAPELKPYDSWVEFAGNLKNEASVINFVAAYGLHTSITSQTSVEGKRDAAMLLIFGDMDIDGDGIIDLAPTDRVDFLNGTGPWANLPNGVTTTGLDNIDLWIGGLAEKTMPFGGMLGSTFNFVFEVQLEKLQDGDRFYYLQRLDGLHFLSEMENNTFAKIISLNADAGHLPSDVFSTPGLILEVDQSHQWNPELLGADPTGGTILTPLVIRDNPGTAGPDTNYLRYTGADHVLLGGSDANDILIASEGDDTLYGDAGNDRLEGGSGNDQYFGGAGDDIITDLFGDDIIRSGSGHDAINAGQGVDLIVADEGQDFIILGADTLDEAFGGVGNDFVLGSKTTEQTLGGEGDDWIEVGAWTGAVGDNFDDQFQGDAVKGHDVFHGDGGFDEFIGEGGDDIWFGSLGRGKFDGMSGYDWTTYDGMKFAVDVDLNRQILPGIPVLPANVALDSFTQVEGASGSTHNDVIRGSDVTAADVPTEGFRGSALDAEGIALITGLQALLAGVGPGSFDANGSFVGGNMLLGGDGSDLLEGRAGDDIIDGDKWLRVRIAVYQTFDASGPTGSNILEWHDSMTTLVTKVMSGQINPGQLKIVRDIVDIKDNVADVDTALFSDVMANYSFSTASDGALRVSHTGGLAPVDGVDTLRNIEKLQFADPGAAGTLNIITGTPFSDNGLPTQGAPPLNQPALNGTTGNDLILGLAGSDVLNGNAGNDVLVGGADGTSATSTTTITTYTDNFNTQSFGNSNGATNWGPDWVETGDNNSPNNGQIQVDDDLANVLGFVTGDGAQIQRTVNLAGATAPTLSYSIVETGLDGGGDNDTVTVWFSRNGTDFVQVDTINSATNSPPLRSIDLTQFGTGSFTANAAIRFIASSLEAGDTVAIDNLSITFTTTTITNTAAGDTLNGGAGDDIYSFSLGDGTDTINEGADATPGLLGDLISIAAPTTGIDPATLLPITTLTGLNAFDNNTGTGNGGLVINYTLPNGAVNVTQMITVNNQYSAINAQNGVERINFNGAVYGGYLLGGTDYLISKADPGGATRVDLTASLANNFIAGENVTNDIIIGGLGNDLIFGGTGDNVLTGGDGDDLIVGGSGAGDNDVIDGGLGADTMVGLAGDDTYVVDDLLDVVVEDLNAGTDRVETLLAALSIEAMANVENLIYTGVDADQFVGTGNSLGNVITGGDLVDTLSGLGGADTLDGGLGADTMIGGDGSDVFFVDDVGDVVTETNADLVIGGTDRVESDIDYTLGANLENLDLNGAALIGTGNALNNVINGNGGANQLFGGSGNDTLNGAAGADVIDGGTGNDTITGGDDNDTIIGGAGDDTIDVGGGFNRIVYNSIGFGADVINSFDSAGGTPTTQDRIDLSGLGITATNFVNRVFESASGANTLITIRENGPASAIQGTILINGSNTAAIDATDFTLAADAPTVPVAGGTAAANTINGTAADNLINGLGGNDTLNGLGGNDFINGGEGADTLNGGDGNDTLSGGTGSAVGAYADNFNAQAYTNSDGSVPWTTAWVEASDVAANPATSGAIQIIGGNTDNLRFGGVTNDANGATLTRGVNLSGATTANLSYTANPDNLDAGENLTVWFTANGTTFVQVDTVTGDTAVTRNLPLTGPFGPNSAIQFRVTGVSNANEIISVDTVAVTFTAPTNNTGVDTLNGDAGDDTIIWNANASGLTDGRDVVNGGIEGGAGDTFVINGNALVEAFRIYTRAAFLAVAGNAAVPLAAATEIVVTRNGTDATSIIAELNEIEEIRLNGADPSGATGAAGGDTFEIVGDFSATSLRLNTITIDGDVGDDTIDISALTSAHRIVFKSNGGNDTIVGTLRPEDVIQLPDGKTAADYTTTTESGVTTMTSGGHSITFTASGGMPQVGGEDDAPAGDDDEPDGCDNQPDGGDNQPDGGDTPAPVPGTAAGAAIIGTANADVLLGTANGETIIALGGNDTAIGGAGADVMRGEDGDDFMSAEGGNDMVFGGAGNDDLLGGAGNDMLYGDAGSDRVFGEAGNDLIHTGAGNDTAYGGEGDDLIVAEAGDGDDTYYGDAGNDTLDMAAITANLTVDLGSGFMGRGSASSSQSGSDTLWNVENVVTGSGADTITANGAVNVIDGGAGNDTFRFLSEADADGDTIVGFQPGDKIDFSGIDANGNSAGNQSFTLVAASTLSSAAQLIVTHETREDGDYTVVQGSVDGDNTAELRLSIKGTHNLTSADFNL